MDRKGKPIYVLGTGLSHDGSACLLKNGEICIAIEKERITRIKGDGANDTEVIKYCLEAEGITINDLSAVVQNANFGFFEYGNDYYSGERLFNDKVKVPIYTISHHLAHAYNAIGTMPFDTAAILVMDGCGSLMDESIDLNGAIVPEQVTSDIKHLYAEKDSFYIYENNKLKTIYKDFSPIGYYLKDYPMHPPTTKDSIGGLYKAVSTYIFGDMSDVGKLMGLAPYGKPNIYKEEIFKLENGRIFVNYNWMKKFRNPARSYEDFKNNFQHFADIAYWVQKEVERAILYIINSRCSLVKADNLAYTGGTALNAVANARILKETPFKNLYLTPAAGDNGLAVGCAYYGWLEILKQHKVLHNGNTFFGKVYSAKEIQQDIDSYLCFSNDLDRKNIYKELFLELPQCLNKETVQSEKNCKMQFILNDGDNFGLLIENGKAKIALDFIEKPTYTFYSDTLSLIRSLIDKEYYVNAVFHKKVIENGSVNLLSIFDLEKLKVKIYNLIRNYKLSGLNYQKEKDIFSAAANLLAAGKVIAWFQDGCEFGARALGHRSILADPRIASMKDFINKNIKFREDFRPFAPSILKENVSEYFHFNSDSPYMILVVEAKDNCIKNCPGVVHSNNSSRIQTVTPDWNPKFYQLIQEFKKITGVPMLLNTSFNKKGMPIIETPIEAINFFYECALDNLVIGNYLFSK